MMSPLDTNACIALINGMRKDIRACFQRATAKEARKMGERRETSDAASPPPMVLFKPHVCSAGFAFPVG
jgi:hypothetical protein